jgi:uncharacterized damage-inducible protein DinB
MTPDQAKATLEFLLGTVEQESGAMQRVLAAVPAGQEEYCPDAKCMKALDLAWHIASSEIMFLTAAARGTFEGAGDGKRPDSIRTGADVAAWYKEELPKAVAQLRALTPEQCLAELNFHNIWKMPAYAWPQVGLTHSIHHRGQLSAYLRPMGAKVPSIYGPSADVSLEEALGAAR